MLELFTKNLGKK